MFKKFFLNRTQPGQAVVLIALAILGLIAMTGLAIDSGSAYTSRRKAQSAGDNAALAAAYKRSGFSGKSLTLAQKNLLIAAARAVTTDMGYEAADVEVQYPVGPDCKGITPNPVNSAYKGDSISYYVQVIVHSSVDTYFAPIVGITHIDSCISAIARGKPFTLVPPFNGNAVVGLNPNGKSFHAHSGSQKWKIKGGGVFANGDAEDDHNKVQFPDGDCVTAVGTIYDFASGVCKYPGSADQAYKYPEDIIAIMPETPACDGTAYEDGGKIYPEAGHEESGSVWEDGFSGDVVDFAPGVYCIPGGLGNIHDQVLGTDVTFYISATDFTMKYNGGGQFNASAPTSGKYPGLLMFSAYSPIICNGTNKGQNVDIRGNGSTPIRGTVFMPSACIDWRGNGEGNADKSMIIGYEVTSNGDADVSVEYNPDDSWKAPDPAAIELTR